MAGSLSHEFKLIHAKLDDLSAKLDKLASELLTLSSHKHGIDNQASPAVVPVRARDGNKLTLGRAQRAADSGNR